MLNEVLEKLGLRYDQLTREEVATYERWQKKLDKPSPTVDDITAWLQSEIARCDEALLDYSLDANKRIFLQATSRLARNLNTILTRPEQEKEQLKQQLELMLKR